MIELFEQVPTTYDSTLLINYGIPNIKSSSAVCELCKTYFNISWFGTLQILDILSW